MQNHSCNFSFILTYNFLLMTYDYYVITVFVLTFLTLN
jgi:hypothetical protein